MNSTRQSDQEMASNKNTDGEPTRTSSDSTEDESPTMPESLSGLLDHFLHSTDGQEQVRIVDLINSLESRSHGPMLLFPAIIAISPIGMIPGMSVVTGTLIILIASQMMFFSKRPWIPKRLENFEFARDKLQSGVKRVKPWVVWFEKAVHSRLEFLAGGIFVYPIAMISIVLALSFYPLAFVPFGVFIPGAAVTLFALGLTARDGLLVAIGLTLTIAAGVTIWSAWPF